MFSVEFGKIYRIFLISSVSELFDNSSRINFFRVGDHYGSKDFEPPFFLKLFIDYSEYSDTTISKLFFFAKT